MRGDGRGKEGSGEKHTVPLKNKENKEKRKKSKKKLFSQIRIFKTFMQDLA